MAQVYYFRFSAFMSRKARLLMLTAVSYVALC